MMNKETNSNLMMNDVQTIRSDDVHQIDRWHDHAE